MEQRIAVTTDAAGADGTVVLAVSGEIDLLTSDEFNRHVTSALNSATTKRLVLDLSGVQFLGSAALSVLSSAANDARANGIDVRLVAADRTILRPLEIAGLHESLPVYDCLETALAQ